MGSPETTPAVPLDPYNGVFLFDKPEGVTSFDSLRTIKRLYGKHCGHAGTLDKAASGLLIVATGKKCKKLQSYMAQTKEYYATFIFGTTTDTLDREGTVTENTGIVPSCNKITDVIQQMFLGKILQVPPVYSAIHVGGKRSYEVAQRGQEVHLEPREVEIYEFEPLGMEGAEFRARLVVSKGTYIRSVARDLGKACGSVAYMSALRRTKIGSFCVESAQGSFVQIE